MFRLSLPSSKITSLTRNLIALLEAKVLVNDALQLIAAGGKSAEAVVARKLYNELCQGKTLSQAFAQFPDWFDRQFIHMVEAGVRTGRTADFLQILVNYREVRDQFRQQLIRAFAYPVFVLLLSICLAMVLLLQVVPRFQQLFIRSGESLPWLTERMLSLSLWLEQYGIYIPIWCLLLWCIVRLGLRWWWFRMQVQRLTIHVPLVRKRIKEAYLRTLATMLKAQLPLVDANNSAAKGCHYIIQSRQLAHISVQLATGMKLDQAWQGISLFNQGDLLAARTGYRGAQLDTLLLLRADYYQQHILNVVKLWLRLLEPVLMLGIGIVIGLIVLAIYLPLFSIGQVL